MQTKEPRYRAIIWYKVGRNRQRWFPLIEGGMAYTAVALAEEVGRWERKPNVVVVGTLVELGA